MTTSRRQTLTAAAWTLPAIVTAVAAPATTASVPPAEPLECRRIPGTGQPQWIGIYTDGTTVTMDNGTAMSSEFGPICRAAGTNPGAGK